MINWPEIIVGSVVSAVIGGIITYAIQKYKKRRAVFIENNNIKKAKKEEQNRQEAITDRQWRHHNWEIENAINDIKELEQCWNDVRAYKRIEIFQRYMILFEDKNDAEQNFHLFQGIESVVALLQVMLNQKDNLSKKEKRLYPLMIQELQECAKLAKD